MKLFSDNNTQEQEVTSDLSITKVSSNQQLDTSSSVLVISSDRERRENIISTLVMFDIIDIDEVDGSLLDNYEYNGVVGIIIADLGHSTNLEQISKAFSLNVPIQSKCIFIGNSDSISFAREIEKLGAAYLHFDSQLDKLARVITDYSVESNVRDSVWVSVLGCKGGSGTSVFTNQIFHSIGTLSGVPLLMIQDSLGSLDLDLIMERAIPKDGSIAAINNSLNVKMLEPNNAIDFFNKEYNRYNIILLDSHIYNFTAERLESVYQNSNSIILVITRDLASLRVAKKFLSECKRRTQESHDLFTKRIFVCLNENRPKKKGDLTNQDISEYIEHPIDLSLPYSPVIEKNESLITSFAVKVLGKKEKQKIKLSMSSLFAIKK